MMVPSTDHIYNNENIFEILKINVSQGIGT